MLRIVIQRVGHENGCIYRLIGYDNARTYHPVEFGSLNELLKVLHSVRPQFGKGLLAEKDGGRDTTILLSELVELNELQLAALGFQRR